MSFSGWSLFGSLANVGASQGINIILNMFFGVAVNAAMGIANQVNATVYQFVSSSQTESDPQIIASYVAGIGVMEKLLMPDRPNDRNQKYRKA